MGYIIGKIVKKEDIAKEDEKIEEGEIVINSQVCMGCGICVNEAPKCFKIENKKVTLIVDKVIDNDWSGARAAMEKCPVNAIRIGESKSLN